MEEFTWGTPKRLVGSLVGWAKEILLFSPRERLSGQSINSYPLLNRSMVLVDYFHIRTIFESHTRHTVFWLVILCSVLSHALKPEEIGDSLSVLRIRKQASRGEVSQVVRGRANPWTQIWVTFCVLSCTPQPLGRDPAGAAINQDCELEYKLRRKWGGNSLINPDTKV